MSHNLNETATSTEAPETQVPESFEELAASRRKWIEEVLRPWCHQATLKQLRQAEVEWLDIAGRVDLNATLWTWEWERFDGLTHPELAGVHETHPVRAIIKDGSILEGYPDSRKSVRGTLVIVGRDAGRDNTVECTPISIDDVLSVELLNTCV